MSLVATQVQSMVQQANLDKYELRRGKYGTLDLFLNQTNDPLGIISEELKERAKKSIGFPEVKVPVLNRNTDITVGNTRTVTLPIKENTSAFVKAVFSTYTWSFSMTPVLYDNNYIAMERAFRNKMMGGVEAFLAKLESVCLAQLAANKTQIIKNPLLFDFATGSLKAKWNQRGDFFRNLEPIMRDNKFYGPLDIVGDIGVESIISELQQHGANNDVNKTNEFAGKTLYYTNGMPKQEGLYAQGYALQKGTVGLLTRFERECYHRTRTPDGHEWDIITLPGTNIQCGTYEYDDVASRTDIAGAASKDMDRVRTHFYGFAVEVGLLTAYNSDPSRVASPIVGLSVDDIDAQYAQPVVIVGGSAPKV